MQKESDEFTEVLTAKHNPNAIGERAQEMILRGSDNTARKGLVTESIVLARLVQLEYECLIPWGHDHRYDIAIDNDGKLIHIQCKTACYLEERGCLEFNTAVTYARVGGKSYIRKGYKGEADYFGVYSPETGKVYLVPVEDVPIGSKGLLRLNATKNNQQKGVKWAQEYELIRIGEEVSQ
jgi:hypothetical protein